MRVWKRRFAHVLLWRFETAVWNTQVWIACEDGFWGDGRLYCLYLVHKPAKFGVRSRWCSKMKIWRSGRCFYRQIQNDLVMQILAWKYSIFPRWLRTKPKGPGYPDSDMKIFWIFPGPELECAHHVWCLFRSNGAWCLMNDTNTGFG